MVKCHQSTHPSYRILLVMLLRKKIISEISSLLFLFCSKHSNDSRKQNQNNFPCMLYSITVVLRNSNTFFFLVTVLFTTILLSCTDSFQLLALKPIQYRLYCSAILRKIRCKRKFDDSTKQQQETKIQNRSVWSRWSGRFTAVTSSQKGAILIRPC